MSGLGVPAIDAIARLLGLSGSAGVLTRVGQSLSWVALPEVRRRTWGLTNISTTATYISGSAPPTAASYSVTWTGSAAASSMTVGSLVVDTLARTGATCGASWWTGAARAGGVPVGVHRVAVSLIGTGGVTEAMQVAWMTVGTATELAAGLQVGVGLCESRPIFGDRQFRVVTCNGGAITVVAATGISLDPGNAFAGVIVVDFDGGAMWIEDLAGAVTHGPWAFVPEFSGAPNHVNARILASGSSFGIAPSHTYGEAS